MGYETREKCEAVNNYCIKLTEWDSETRNVPGRGDIVNAQKV